MFKNGQTYIKNLAVWTPQDFWCMFDQSMTLCMDGLRGLNSISWDRENIGPFFVLDSLHRFPGKCVPIIQFHHIIYKNNNLLCK